MVNVSSLFGQIVSGLFSAVNFDNLVAKWGAERHAKGFRSKTQLVSMLFCHLAGADSLREIVNGLGCCNGKLVHPGIREPPGRSTLSYAISRRPARCFSSRVGRLVCSSTITVPRNFSGSCSGGCRIISAPRAPRDAGEVSGSPPQDRCARSGKAGARRPSRQPIGRYGPGSTNRMKRRPLCRRRNS